MSIVGAQGRGSSSASNKDILRHLISFSGVQGRENIWNATLRSFDAYGVIENRLRSGFVSGSIELKHDNDILQKDFLESQQTVERLTNRGYITTAFFLLAISLASYIVWSQRKSKLKQETINELLRKEVEKSRRLNDEKTKYFSILSHELRTPIFVVTGLARLLQEPENNTKENIAAIINSGNLLLFIVNNMLQHGKLEEHSDVKIDNTDFDITTMLDEVMQSALFMASQKGIELKVNRAMESSPFYVTGDRQKLTQVLINLLSNAIRYSPAGKEVEFFVTEKPLDAVETVFRFSIRDHGVGIEPDRLLNLFDYRNTSYSARSEDGSHGGGMGIGLFVVARFIKAMGSKIEVESEPGVGSTFAFNVICKKSKLKKDHQHHWRPSKKVTVLVVDDNDISRMVTKRLLHGIGVDCVTASEDQAVIEIICQQKISLVLMDLNMGLVSGIELTKKIRNAGIFIPIIAHTAACEGTIDVEDLSDDGIQDILIKPYTNDVLREKLSNHLQISFQ